MATKKRYSFKGLDEIFGESVADLVDNLEGDTKKAQELASKIKISQLKPNPYQPRRVFNDEQIKELADSIKLHGIIQPIIVNDSGSDVYEIIAGERRYRAAKLAGLTEVPVVVAKLNATQMEEFAIIENIQRVDLTEIEEAIAYKQLGKALNLKQEAIASRVGKSRSHVANIMRLLNLPDYIQDALLKKEISMGQAKPLLAIASNESILKSTFQDVINKNLTARQVEELVKKLTSEKNGEETKKTELRDPLLNNIESKLMIRFGTKVSIKGNKVMLSYNDDEDLNRLLELLGYEFEG